MEFTHVRFYGNRPLDKARSDPAIFAATLRAYARKGFKPEFVGPNWRVRGAVPREQIHEYFRLPQAVRVRHLGPSLSEDGDARLLRVSLAAPALLAGRTPRQTLHYHKDPVAALAARRYRGIHILEVVIEPRSAVDRLAMRAVHGVWANAPALADWYEETYPSLRGRVAFRRGFLDPELDRPEDHDRVASRAALGISPDARVVAYAGKIAEGNEELPLITEACSGLGVTLVVVGGDEKKHAWVRSSCPPDLHLLTLPMMAPSELGRVFAAADVLVSYYPSTILTIDWVDPGKIYPYLASGKAVVAADHPSMRDLLLHGKNAELAAPDAPAALRAALARVLDDPAYAEALGAEGRKTAATYTIDAKTDRVLEFAGSLA